MVLRFLHWLTDRLPARFIDGENNEPYLERYHLFGIKCLGVAAFIHRFVASDPDRGLHDHPWSLAVSCILVGGYREIRPNGARVLRRWQINVIRGNDFHRVLLEGGQEAWSLFLHGPRLKGWGFLRNGEYIPYVTDKDSNPHENWQLTAPTGKVLREARALQLATQTKSRSAAHG